MELIKKIKENLGEEARSLLIWLGVLLLVVLLGYGYLYRPRLARLGAVKGELARLAVDSQQVSQKEAAAEKAEAEITHLKETLQGWQAKISSRRSTSQILADLSPIAAKVGIESIDFKTHSPKDFQSLFSGVPIRINLVATYSQLGEFLESLSQLPGLITVERLTVQRERSLLPFLKGEILITSYYIE